MSMGPVLHSFAYSLDFLREQVRDLSDSDMVCQPAGMPNHPAWTIGHLTFTCEAIGGAIGLSPWLPAEWVERYGSGSLPVPDPDRYETREAALATLSDAQSRITQSVRNLSDDRLDDPFPDAAYHDVFPTIRHALTQVLVGHTSFHVGQLAVWRRAMKVKPMLRSFE